ncbi:MAG: HD domain-containing protein [Candidatus Hydrogenedentes bacterium]|nr:HD domain-containing protein [Candidatus Hydrogenedentota bacterium]
MLKRIAVAGTETVDKALAAEAAEQGLQLKPMPLGAALPPGSGATLAPAEPSSLAAAAAMALAHDSLLVLLAEAVDSREGLVMGSSERLRDHATRFSKALGLNADEQFSLERGALLHDVGKILLSNEVLLKKAVLDYEDWLLLQAHTTMGADLLLEHQIHADVADIVRYHHECWNGEGYPKNLEKGAIPLLARIMKVLDVYCSMTSPRHYRSGHASHEEAIKHLKEERGERFDPELVDAFLKSDVGRPFDWAGE